MAFSFEDPLLEVIQDLLKTLIYRLELSQLQGGDFPDITNVCKVCVDSELLPLIDMMDRQLPVWYSVSESSIARNPLYEQYQKQSMLNRLAQNFFSAISNPRSPMWDRFILSCIMDV